MIVAAVFFLECCTGGTATQEDGSGGYAFEITDLKKEKESETYGTTLKIRGLVKLKSDRPRAGAVMLILKRRVTFKSSGIAKEGEDGVLIRNGSGLIDSSVYFSDEEAKGIGSELPFGTVTWEPVGVMELQPASVSVK